MIYFIQGTEQAFIDKRVEEIMKTAQEEQTLYYSSLETELSVIVQEICTDDLFGEQKFIILEDLDKVDHKQYFEFLTSSIATSMQQSEHILIIKFEREEALTKTQQKQMKTLLDVTKIEHFKQKNEQQLIPIVMKALGKQSTLDRHQIAILIDRYKNNLSFLLQEIDLIKLRKAETDAIDFTDFTNRPEFFEEQVFELISMIESKNQQKSFEILDNILLHQQNVFGLLALLFKNYKEMYQIQSLLNVGYTIGQASKRLNIHEFRAKKLVASSRQTHLSFYPYIIQELIDADVALKTGKAQNIVLPTLFLKIFAS